MRPEMGEETVFWPDGIPELLNSVVFGVGSVTHKICPIAKDVVHLPEEAIEDGGVCCHRLDDWVD